MKRLITFLTKSFAVSDTPSHMGRSRLKSPFLTFSNVRLRVLSAKGE